MEEVLLILIFVAAVRYLYRQFAKTLKGDTSPWGCGGCGGCDSYAAAPNNEPKKSKQK